MNRKRIYPVLFLFFFVIITAATNVLGNILSALIPIELIPVDWNSYWWVIALVFIVLSIIAAWGSMHTPWLSGMLGSRDKPTDPRTPIVMDGSNFLADNALAIYLLPRDIPDFTGRKNILTRVISQIKQTVRHKKTARSLFIVTGAAGTGKSTLVIHAAHQVKNHFPDAHLYVDLRGAGGQPRSPFDVLGSFLRRLGFSEESIPKDLEGRSGLCRSILSTKRALIILDNATNEEQVRPLLPGTATSVVLITARTPLSALEGTISFDLEEMEQSDAYIFLASLVGKQRIQDEPDAAEHITELCGYLPLALRIVGEKLKTRLNWSLADYMNSLKDEQRRLQLLSLGDLSVRASFMLSYQDLTPDSAHILRMPGILVGYDFSYELVAALTGIDDQTAQIHLEQLVDIRLLQCTHAGRYHSHDLIRLFVRERLDEEEPPETQELAHKRAATWYLEFIREHGGEGNWDGYNRLEQERENIIYFIQWCHRANEWLLEAQLVQSFTFFLGVRGYWHDRLQLGDNAIDSARKGGYTSLLAWLLTHTVSWIFIRRGDLNTAKRLLQEAEDLYTQLDDKSGLSYVYRFKGRIAQGEQDIECAEQYYHNALQILISPQYVHSEDSFFRRERMLASIKGELARLSINRCQYDEAECWYQEAMKEAYLAGDERRWADIAINFGFMLIERDKPLEARGFFEQALKNSKEAGRVDNVARCRLGFGLLEESKGHKKFALNFLNESMSTFETLQMKHELHQAQSAIQRIRGPHK